ncbi:hypothetical protein XAC3810_240026 [Xanthomonas citri pv. citri]|uniref:Uncharacterized protein n=1 Tax=Xanthomonas citri pv. citri TaxID=611301 RepID=A0A0U5FAR2_XANCI|nr:hypothetical protein XAC9322_220026 [Xanthomonas citri pv. citri]CEE19869.1 hypothetical protein XAC3824_220026 [Xanthomonas citri pv. citri]CEE20996.1 hypothetical protein XAC1083_220026 [Xanthomonas citri pv. citri]CEE29377.1 hypothetical protein XAC3810_240026 [Xanthomonas citri pv. citri]CEE31449.1 hypothetical protein XAC902_270025 [Xanthomonas citri pv. citri]
MAWLTASVVHPHAQAAWIARHHCWQAAGVLAQSIPAQPMRLSPVSFRMRGLRCRGDRTTCTTVTYSHDAQLSFTDTHRPAFHTGCHRYARRLRACPSPNAGACACPAPRISMKCRTR